MVSIHDIHDRLTNQVAANLNWLIYITVHLACGCVNVHKHVVGASVV